MRVGRALLDRVAALLPPAESAGVSRGEIAGQLPDFHPDTIRNALCDLCLEGRAGFYGAYRWRRYVRLAPGSTLQPRLAQPESRDRAPNYDPPRPLRDDGRFAARIGGRRFEDVARNVLIAEVLAPPARLSSAELTRRAFGDPPARILA